MVQKSKLLWCLTVVATMVFVVSVAQLTPWLARAVSVSQISPNSGSTTGGNIVTITGDGFEPDIPTMQNFGADKCASMDVYDGNNIGALLTLKDTRNNQTYTVGKLADGNCWMLDNLKIADVAVDNTDTDLNTIAGFTIPALDASGTADNNNPRIYGPVPGDGAGDTNYGYLYNWSAMTAGESTTSMPGNGTYGDVAPNSICPSGWRMPTGAAAGDFAVLNGSMFNGVPSAADATSDTARAAHWGYTGAFRGVFAGMWNYASSGFTSSQYVGSLWSSSAFPGGPLGAYSALLYTGGVSPNASNGRNQGLSVRCLARASTTDTNIHYDTKPTVSINGVAVGPNDVELVSDSELRVRMPAHLAGVVNIVITLGAETRTLQYEYVASPAPTLPLVPGVPNTGVGRGSLTAGQVEMRRAL